MTDLREQRRSQTRGSIIDAVHRVLADEHPASLSMPRVADVAGVSLRTLYRYFPNKADLVDAASQSYAVEVSDVMGVPTDLDGLESFVVTMWAAFDDSLPGVLSQHATPAGRELRQKRLARSRAQVRAVLQHDAPDLGEHDADRLVDTVVLLTSSATYLELTQHLGHSSADAAHLAMSAVRAAVADAIGAPS